MSKVPSVQTPADEPAPRGSSPSNFFSCLIFLISFVQQSHLRSHAQVSSIEKVSAPNASEVKYGFYTYNFFVTSSDQIDLRFVWSRDQLVREPKEVFTDTWRFNGKHFRIGGFLVTQAVRRVP